MQWSWNIVVQLPARLTVRVRVRVRARVWSCLAFVLSAQAGNAQQAASSKRLVMLVSPASDRASFVPLDGSTVSQSEIIREIDDPRNGDRWVLVRDASHPAGPGLLLRINDSAGETTQAVRSKQTGQTGWSTPKTSVELNLDTVRDDQAQVPIVHAGDRVIVEEHTAVIEARLEAVAIGPAFAGASFIARLSIGGRVVRAVALGPGRAVIQERTQP